MTASPPTPASVAQWMFDRLKADRWLDRWVAANEISQRFGDSFLTQTEGGTVKVKDSVLKKFRVLYGANGYYEGRGDDGGWGWVDLKSE